MPSPRPLAFSLTLGYGPFQCLHPQCLSQHMNIPPEHWLPCLPLVFTPSPWPSSPSVTAAPSPSFISFAYSPFPNHCPRLSHPGSSCKLLLKWLSGPVGHSVLPLTPPSVSKPQLAPKHPPPCILPRPSGKPLPGPLSYLTWALPPSHPFPALNWRQAACTTLCLEWPLGWSGHLVPI